MISDELVKRQELERKARLLGAVITRTAAVRLAYARMRWEDTELADPETEDQKALRKDAESAFKNWGCTAAQARDSVTEALAAGAKTLTDVVNWRMRRI